MEFAVSYEVDVRRVVEANVDEIRADLDKARFALQRAVADVDGLKKTVGNLEALLAAAGKTPSAPAARSLTLHEAMSVVLTETPHGMRRAGDLAAEINRRRLYSMQDGRPVEKQQIHARVKNYEHLFVKEGTFIRLRRPDELP